MMNDELVMIPYVGTKELLATAMNRRVYCNYRGWELPVNEDGNDKGMLVEYLDGGKSNDERHNGYISWSPIDVFENSYKVNGTWRERLIIENDELLVKLLALRKALKDGVVPKDQVEILTKQKEAMAAYQSILSDRLQS